MTLTLIDTLDDVHDIPSVPCRTERGVGVRRRCRCGDRSGIRGGCCRWRWGGTDGDVFDEWDVFYKWFLSRTVAVAARNGTVDRDDGGGTVGCYGEAAEYR